MQKGNGNIMISSANGSQIRQQSPMAGNTPTASSNTTSDVDAHKEKQDCIIESVNRDITRVMVSEAHVRGKLLATQIGGNSTSAVQARQQRNIESGVGALYPHPRDKAAWDKLPEDAPIHTFLPGYATGDRYTATLSMLIEPRLKLTIAFQEGDETQEKHAREALESVKKSLAANGVSAPGSRVSLVSFKGESKTDNLKSARESLNDPAARQKFQKVEGDASPLTSGAQNEHMFHISISTAVMAKHWGDDFSKGNVLTEKSAEMRAKVANMIAPETRSAIDKIVDSYIKDNNIKDNSVALWVANRPNANAREAEAISNPIMFEQIRDALKSAGKSSGKSDEKGKKGIDCFYIADGFKNEVAGKKTENRHPYQTKETPDIGKFWADHGQLKEREHQWYFVDTLLQKVKSPALIGIRSGALEPLALFGHNVIYLEHEDMFTPERHGSWQGRIPYNRLVTQQRTGYHDAEHEIVRNQKVQELILDNGHKKLDALATAKAEALTTGKTVEEFIKEIFTEDRSSLDGDSMQNKIAAINDKISDGVMLPDELALLSAMVEKKAPAFKIAATASSTKNIAAKTLPD
ncbi:hypothetical protein BCF11_2708 [Collimonas sp. PA-H2]|nr:hypothetical protein BCF11_2708 [Collimonas sp. PA-H2]